jgi:hypothetical protein
MMRRCLEVSTSGFYAWACRTPEPQARQCAPAGAYPIHEDSLGADRRATHARGPRRRGRARQCQSVAGLQGWPRRRKRRFAASQVLGPPASRTCSSATSAPTSPDQVGHQHSRDREARRQAVSVRSAGSARQMSRSLLPGSISSASWWRAGQCITAKTANANAS